MSGALNLLGMARRAGAVQIGEESAAQAVLDHKARLILVAADAGASGAARMQRLESEKVPVLTVADTKAELGNALGFAGCAAALLVCGAFALAHKPTPQQMIEQGDERNAAINGKAGLRAFEAFSVLAPLAALALYAFEQISTAGVLTIIAVEVVASIVYFAQIARMQRIM